MSFGIINNIYEDKKYNFGHQCSTREGSSGSPILNKSNKLIGIHKEGKDIFNFNKGTFLNYPIKEFIQQNYKNKKNLVNNEIISKKIKNYMYEVVVGIYIDSSRIGFAYTFLDKKKIIHGSIFGSSVDYRVSNEIILDDNNNIIQFGSYCQRFLKERSLEAGHYFKLDFYKININNVIIAVNTGKKFPLTLVIQKILESVKKIAIEEEISRIKSDLGNKTEKIKWLVTIPAICDDQQKNLMIKSCLEAGLIKRNDDKSSLFVLEQEAASLYCSVNKNMEKGKMYIICNLGSETGYIFSHLFGSNKNADNIPHFYGEVFGSNEIDRLIFKDIIKKLLGCQDFNSYYSKYLKKNIKGKDEKEELYYEWLELERQIKDFKECISIQKVEKNNTFPINFSSIYDIFDDNIDINNLVVNYNDSISDNNLKLKINNKIKKKIIIEFPYKIAYNYIKMQANSICNIINNICAKDAINGLIFVGSYCSNEILIDLIKDGLNYPVTTFLPANPSVAITEGIVLFGLEALT